MKIEDYALIGDTQGAALVGRDGSIDWLCVPRLDSAACFAALLGTPEHGRWRLAPAADRVVSRRRYFRDTLVLETEHETPTGAVRVTDFMPPRRTEPDLVRIVDGLRGEVTMSHELRLRFDYGSASPWLRFDGRVLKAIAGPDAVTVWAPVPQRALDGGAAAEFTVRAGERASFVLVWHPSHLPEPAPAEPASALAETQQWWSSWCQTCSYSGPWRDAVQRSLITLKALTFAPTGGIVAAATTSLPETLGGVRNWDYRFCWLRDATFTLYALLQAGYREEAEAWREWLLRAVAGDPGQLQIMYGASGERRLTELELPWLPGYEQSRPVRIGNAAVQQFQLDVFGEVMDLLHQARRLGIAPNEHAWALQRELLEGMENLWREPDEGLWEVRGPRRHFTHSKVMAWVAVDRAVKAIERFKLEGPLARWKQLREDIHREVCERGFSTQRNAFTQFYGSSRVDASLLMLPLVGFLPASDPRIAGTVRAVEEELLWEGFVLRYRTDDEGEVDGLPGHEGAFLLCTFWLADCYALLGRQHEAEKLFERLLSLRNDVGLMSEQYDPIDRRFLGNFPQAFSHVGLINTARNLSRELGPADHRREG